MAGGGPGRAPSTSGCGTGCSAGSATGAARSRSCTAGLRRGAGAVRPAATGAAGAEGRGPEAEGRLTAGRGRGLGQRRMPAVRRSGPARQRHDGHVRGLVVVLPALLLTALQGGPVRRGGGPALDAGRHLHRRCGARGAAPAVRPVLHQGAARHGDGRLRRAVRCPAEPGLRDQPGQEDEQVAGQRRQSGGPTCGVRSGRRTPDPGVRRSAGGRHRLVRDVPGRVTALPEAGLAAER